MINSIHLFIYIFSIKPKVIYFFYFCFFWGGVGGLIQTLPMRDDWAYCHLLAKLYNYNFIYYELFGLLWIENINKFHVHIFALLKYMKSWKYHVQLDLIGLKGNLHSGQSFYLFYTYKPPVLRTEIQSEQFWYEFDYKCIILILQNDYNYFNLLWKFFCHFKIISDVKSLVQHRSSWLALWSLFYAPSKLL